MVKPTLKSPGFKRPQVLNTGILEDIDIVYVCTHVCTMSVCHFATRDVPSVNADEDRSSE